MLQTTMNMCETVHNNMTFTTVEQKIACEYIEAYTCNFLVNSGESQVVVTSFTHIHSGLQQNLFF